MIIQKKIFSDLFWQPKKVLLSRKAITIFVVILIAFSGYVYLTQRSSRTNHKQHKVTKHQTAPESILAKPQVPTEHLNMINELQEHIASLNSRIKHLSLDNKRLTTTGHRLSQQLDNTSSELAKKMSKTKLIQLELATLDQNLIHRYDAFLEQQETFISLKHSCKNKKDNNQKCEKYRVLKESIESLSLQIKHLKDKREVLLSEIARSSAGL